ncbi:hypothetical protein PtB15_17B98 [Puccinia triticina]|nr:hypothetical protein PtB15_17B98 [Puccinia triticina]
MGERGRDAVRPPPPPELLGGLLGRPPPPPELLGGLLGGPPPPPLELGGRLPPPPELAGKEAGAPPPIPEVGSGRSGEAAAKLRTSGVKLGQADAAPRQRGKEGKLDEPPPPPPIVESANEKVKDLAKEGAGERKKAEKEKTVEKDKIKKDNGGEEDIPEVSSGKEGKAGKGEGELGGGRLVREAAITLAQANRLIENSMQFMQSSTANSTDIKKAAELAVKLGNAEDFLREVLASASQDPASAQKSLGIIRDNGQVLTLQRQLNLAGKANEKVAENKFVNDGAQKKSIEEAQKNPASQSKTVDDQIAIIAKEGTDATAIAAAAQKALEGESAQHFSREVLASGAKNPAEAMQALGSVRDHQFNQVVAGLRSIAANSKNAEAVKTAVSVVNQGRKFIVAANEKLIELSGGTAAEVNVKDNNKAAEEKTKVGAEAAKQNKDNKLADVKKNQTAESKEQAGAANGKPQEQQKEQPEGAPPVEEVKNNAGAEEVAVEAEATGVEV